MTKLLVIFALAMGLAYVSEQNTRAAAGHRYSVWQDWAYLCLVVALTLFAGLRTSYNDTGNYIRGFSLAPGLAEFLSVPENLNPFKNPLFYLYQSLLVEWGADAQVLIFTTAAFTQICFLRFFKRYSRHFTFSVFIYFTLGTFCLTLAAIKQLIAMSILTLAFPYLQKKNWVMYFALVVLAMLFHTYAISFVVLPLFTQRPWKLFTYLFAFVTVVLMMNFEAVITDFLEQAGEMGKTIADYEVFDNISVNVMRLAVYAVPPLISLVFQRWLFHDSSSMGHVLIHMSIISFACMCMGTQSGANMFGRMANYFELGTICTLPRMLEKTFEEKSYRLVSAVAMVCFLGFFVYANYFSVRFDNIYSALSAGEFILILLNI